MLCFVHPISRFWFLETFGDEVTKIRKYYVIFAYILQGKMDKTQKNWKENYATNVTKIPKTKRRKYRMNKTFILIFYGFQKEMMTQKIKEKCHEIKVFLEFRCESRQNLTQFCVQV